ncbi:MAG: transglutaminase family protein, partial [Planctomycetota bacterium]
TAIYVFVARRLNLRVAPLPLPGHVMLRAYGDQEAVIVDPYHHGHVRTERECLQYLEHHGLRFRPDWFRDAEDRTMFERQVNNLMRTYQLRGLKTELQGISRLKAVLERYSGFDEPRTRSVPLS